MTKATATPAPLTAQAFLDLATAQQKLVPIDDVPGIGRVYVLVMTVGQREVMRNRWVEINKNPDNQVSFSAMVLQATVCDSAGDLILSSLSPEQINDIPSPTTEPILNTSLKINGFLETAAGDARKN